MNTIGLDPTAGVRTSAPGRLALPAAPVVSFQDGVLLIEDAGVILRNDRVFDLPLETIELVPSGDGYDVSLIPSAYVPVNGLPVFTGQTGWQAAQIGLGAFDFPFGDEGRSTVWVTTSNMISFEPPSEPVKIGLCTEGCSERFTAPLGSPPPPRLVAGAGRGA